MNNIFLMNSKTVNHWRHWRMAPYWKCDSKLETIDIYLKVYCICQTSRHVLTSLTKLHIYQIIHRSRETYRFGQYVQEKSEPLAVIGYVFEAVAHAHGTFERRHARMALVHSETAKKHVSRRRTRDAGVRREHVKRRRNFSNAKHSKFGEKGKTRHTRRNKLREQRPPSRSRSHVSAATRHPSAVPRTRHRAAAGVGGGGEHGRSEVRAKNESWIWK